MIYRFNLPYFFGSPHLSCALDVDDSSFITSLSIFPDSPSISIGSSPPDFLFFVWFLSFTCSRSLESIVFDDDSDSSSFDWIDSYDC